MYEILNDRAIIKIIGSDGRRFLQNMVTNDILKNNYCYTYLLNNQGRYLFDFFVYIHSPEEIYIDINQNHKILLINHLKFYKLRSKIEIIDLMDEYQVAYSREAFSTGSLITIRDPRYNLLSFRSIIKKKDGSNGKLYQEDKYNYAIIDGYEDLIVNKSIPIEYGAEELKAISYDKGCYVGQEVISRAKYQGVVRKKIYKIEADYDLSDILKNVEILAADEKIGIICSTYQNKAIALIREEKYHSKKESKITVNSINIRLLRPCWYR